MRKKLNPWITTSLLAGAFALGACGQGPTETPQQEELLVSQNGSPNNSVCKGGTVATDACHPISTLQQAAKDACGGLELAIFEPDLQDPVCGSNQVSNANAPLTSSAKYLCCPAANTPNANTPNANTSDPNANTNDPNSNTGDPNKTPNGSNANPNNTPNANTGSGAGPNSNANGAQCSSGALHTSACHAIGTLKQFASDICVQQGAQLAMFGADLQDPACQGVNLGANAISSSAAKYLCCK